MMIDFDAMACARSISISTRSCKARVPAVRIMAIAPRMARPNHGKLRAAWSHSPAAFVICGGACGPHREKATRPGLLKVFAFRFPQELLPEDHRPSPRGFPVLSCDWAEVELVQRRDDVHDVRAIMLLVLDGVPVECQRAQFLQVTKRLSMSGNETRLKYRPPCLEAPLGAIF